MRPREAKPFARTIPKYAEVLTDGAFAYTAIGAGGERFQELIEGDLADPPCAVHFAVFQFQGDLKKPFKQGD